MNIFTCTMAHEFMCEFYEPSPSRRERNAQVLSWSSPRAFEVRFQLIYMGDVLPHGSVEVEGKVQCVHDALY